MKYFPWIAIAFVAAAVIGAFFLVGSPTHQRLVRFDERRLSDLQSIQYQVSNYFTTKGQLPAALADMKGFEGFGLPIDPENGASYEYAVKTPMQFQLCANFALASDEQAKDSTIPRPAAPYGKETTSTSWQHPAGRGCFDIALEQRVSNSPYPVAPSVTVRPAV